MTAAVLSVPPGEVLGWTLLSIEAKDIGAQYPHHFKGALRGRTTKWVSVQISQLRSAYSIDVANDHLLLVEAARRGLMPPTAHHPYAEFAALGAAVQRLRRGLDVLPPSILQTMNSLAAGHLLTHIAAHPDLSGVGKVLSQSALTTRCTLVTKSLGLPNNMQLFAAALLAGLLDVDVPPTEATISLIPPGTTKLDRGPIEPPLTTRVTLPGSIVVTVKGPLGAVVQVSSGGVSREIVVGGGSTGTTTAETPPGPAEPTAGVPPTEVAGGDVATRPSAPPGPDEAAADVPSGSTPPAPAATTPVAAPAPPPAAVPPEPAQPAPPVSPEPAAPPEPPKDPILATIKAAKLSPHGDFLFDETTEEMINLHWVHVVELIRTRQLEPHDSLAPFVMFLRDDPPPEQTVTILQKMADGMSNTKIDESLGFPNGSNRKRAILAVRSKFKVRPGREKVMVVIAMLTRFVR